MVKDGGCKMILLKFSDWVQFIAFTQEWSNIVNHGHLEFFLIINILNWQQNKHNFATIIIILKLNRYNYNIYLFIFIFNYLKL